MAEEKSLATKLQDAQYKAIEAVNAIVECNDAEWQDRHAAIERVRLHLEARAEQSKPETGDWLE